MRSVVTLAIAKVVLLGFAAIAIISVTAQDRPTENVPLFKVEKVYAESLAFSPDGQKLACDLALSDRTGQIGARGEFGEDIPKCLHVAFSPNGKQIASVHFDDGLIQARHAISLWNVAAGNKLQKLAILQKKENQRPTIWHIPQTAACSRQESLTTRQSFGTRRAEKKSCVWIPMDLQSPSLRMGGLLPL
jgi:WD40 repeat protein